MQLMGVIRRRLSAGPGGAAGDQGLTLIELLVTIAILGVIIAPLTGALITYFQHTDDTTDRLGLSHDAQISSAYFAQDVQSMGKHDWGTDGFPLTQSVFTDASTYPCGTVGSPIVQLVWDDPGTAKGGPVWRVSYYLKPVDGGLSELHRLICAGGGATPTSDVVVAHNVSSVTGPTCSSTCTGSTPPQSVTLVLHLLPPHSAVSDSLTVTLTGQRRQT